MLIKLNKRELDTVLASLRYYQGLLESGKPATGIELGAIHNLASARKEPLSPEDIEILCDRLNR